MSSLSSGHYYKLCTCCTFPFDLKGFTDKELLKAVVVCLDPAVKVDRIFKLNNKEIEALESKVDNFIQEGSGSFSCCVDGNAILIGSALRAILRNGLKSPLSENVMSLTASCKEFIPILRAISSDRHTKGL